MLTELRRNLESVEARIRRAQGAGSHAAGEVRVVVVTKAAPPEIFPVLFEAGVRDVGENRVQAALARRPAAPASLRWHGIGHLQRNKAAEAAEIFDVFHALDSERLAERLESVLARSNRRWPVYIQVNAAEDPSKGGVRPQEALAFVTMLTDHPHLLPLGFMTMTRLGAAEDEARATFRCLREIRDEAVRLGMGREAPAGLSMGMSDDFEWAVEEGATLVRIGSAIFEDVPFPSRADKEDRR